ncbi:hypothetical protein NKH77_27850 [Streptomyces sp. M19]
MTGTPTPEGDGIPSTDWDELHTAEVTVAMNWVIRTCQDVVRDHSHKIFWTPAGTETGTQTPEHLINTARADVLNRLQRAVHSAQSVIAAIEHERHTPHHDGSE